MIRIPPVRDSVSRMKKTIKKPVRVKLDLARETIKLLDTDQLGAAAGGNPSTHCPTLLLSCRPCHTC